MKCNECNGELRQLFYMHKFKYVMVFRKIPVYVCTKCEGLYTKKYIYSGFINYIRKKKNEVIK